MINLFLKIFFDDIFKNIKYISILDLNIKHNDKVILLIFFGDIFAP